MKKILLGLIITILLTINLGVFADENINALVINDKRCLECQTAPIEYHLLELNNLSDVNFKHSDFSDEGIADYLKENNIKKLPAIIFNSNNIDSSINNILIPLSDGRYKLPIGSTFDPFEERSDRGFKMVDEDILKEIKNKSYIKGNNSAKITILEYSDLECPFCAKLHNSGTIKKLENKYGKKINIISNHFPLLFHSNAQKGAEILECVGKQKGSNSFYELMKISYLNKNSSEDFLIKEAIKLGLNEDKIKKCLTDGIYTEKVKNQMQVGTETFGITGTPSSILINNKTGEYIIITGAYPVETFIEGINSLLLPEIKNYKKIYIISRTALKRSYNQIKYIKKIDEIVSKLSNKKLEKIFNKLLKIDRNTKNFKKYTDFLNYFEASIALKLGK